MQNQKVKLPADLQIDSVSPATQLLDKRRLMYEVQKSFEDQKEDFREKERRFKMQEHDLRQKDVLIQDNLIKFSNHLQIQENRKQKNIELKKNEDEKIADMDRQIEIASKKLEQYKLKSEKIEAKVNEMRIYERFMEMVRDANQDEFQELNDIVSRYK